MRKRKIVLLISSLMFLIIFTSGCWDKVEIDERAFVLGLGLDISSDEQNEFLLSLAIPNLPVITGQSSGEDPAYVKKVSDQSILGAYKKMSTRINKLINIENLEVILFGVDLLSNPVKVKEVLDHLERNPSYSRNLPVLVSRSTAEDILNIKPVGSDVVGGYIAGIFKNNSQYISFFNRLYLGDMLQEALEHNGTFIIPEVKTQGDEVMLGGAAVVKDFEFKGWLNESEVRSIAWVRDSARETQVNFEFMGTTLPFVFTNSETKVFFELEDNHLNITIDIFTEGEVTEFVFYDTAGDLENEEYIRLLENSLSFQMQKEIEAVIRRMQNEFKADLLRLDEILKIKDKNLYLQTKENWDEYFSVSDITVKIETKVRRFGEIK